MMLFGPIEVQFERIIEYAPIQLLSLITNLLPVGFDRGSWS